jgi:hypothetical protein
MKIFGMRFFEKEPPAPLPNNCSVCANIEPEEAPDFRRTYKAQLQPSYPGSGIFSVEMTMYTLVGSRRMSGYAHIKQPDGKSIMFLPDEIANAAIDPILVPLVESACHTIKEMDKEFIASDPKTFTDREGKKWLRCNNNKGSK